MSKSKRKGISPMENKHHSEEIKKKMSNLCKGKKREKYKKRKK